MEKQPSLLDGLTIASPCTVSWDSMTGDERVRACAQCRLNVYNLSEMTKADAENLIREKEGRLCVRFFRRADGTILTKDCPVGLRAARLKMARLAASAVALVAVIAAGLGLRRRTTACSVPQHTIGEAAYTPAQVKRDGDVKGRTTMLMGAPPPMGATAGVPAFRGVQGRVPLAPVEKPQ
jgi:hypothetical protein